MDVKGWDGNPGWTFKSAPQVMWLYMGLLVFGALIILIPNAPLTPIVLLSQVANGVMLPFVLIFMLYLINNKELTGGCVNSKTFDIIAWVTVVIMIVLTGALVVTILFPHLRA